MTTVQWCTFCCKRDNKFETVANTDINQKDAAFKNNVPLRSCTTKIKNTLINNLEDLDIVMLLYDLLDHSRNCFMTSENLWNYSRDKVDAFDDDNASDGK